MDVHVYLIAAADPPGSADVPFRRKLRLFAIHRRAVPGGYSRVED
jgi:hypothetical protein